MNKISSKHFILFIVGSALISLKVYPSVFINFGGRDTWLIALIACIIFTAFLTYITNICISTKTFDIRDIFIQSTPRFISIILIGIFTLALFLNALEAASVEINSLHSTIFLDTPVWYALIFFLFPSFFVLNKNLRTILIFIIASVFALLVNGVIFLILSQPYKEVTQLLPVLGNGFPKNYYTALFSILGALSSFIIVAPFIKYVEDHKNLRKNNLYAAGIVSVFVILSFIGIITAFGPERGKNIFYPEFVLGQRIKLVDFLEFGEVFFINQTVIGFFVKYILSTYSILTLHSKYIKKKPLFIGIYSFIVFVLATFIGGNNYLLYFTLKNLQLINLVVFFIIPLIIYTIYLIKYKTNSKSTKFSK
ncbi:MAG: endospore germination permease [Clostridiales bacterium]|nr:endospore germination permease [Clostridiales bacterium]